MSRSSSSLVFDLIKTLEPIEKSYIKKQFSKNDKNLKQLFEDLNNVDVFNKTNFIKRNRGKGYITHLTRNKSYLRKKILDELIHYNTKSIPQINYIQKFNAIYILVHKGLLKQAIKLTKLVIEENEQLENYMQCYELCSLFINLSVNNITSVLPKEILNAFKQKRCFYVKQISLIEKFSEFTDIHNKQITDEQKIEAIEQKFSSFKLKNVSEPPEEYPFHTKRVFYFSKNELARLRNEPQTAISFLEKTVKLYMKYSYFLKKDYIPFITDALNFLNSLLLNKQYNQFFKEYDKINLIFDEIKRTKAINDFIASYFVIKYLFYQTACTGDMQYQKAHTFSNKYQTFIESQKNLSDQFLAASRTSIAVAQINVQRFEEALDAINPIEKTKFYDYQYELRLVQIISHYRLGNDLVLDSLFTSFIYYLKKQEKNEQIKAIRTLKKCIEKQNFDALQNVEFEELNSLNVQFALTTTLVPE